ncbi:unnamed protein product [Moneuplotes crassus]|uniref:Uncharacterized protein n=1 Tax=Euplotes crassus TaxID=5936 RepID=A0AAD1Y6G2_EUPCR|nr:unnamed protein product [Moneuplotes crassus]
MKKTCKKTEGSLRPDIENRKALRIVKKFFHQLFLYHNDKLKNKRFTKVSSSEILEALEQLVSVYIPQTHSKEMAECLFHFLNFHSSDASQLESEAALAGMKLYECTHKYTRYLFNRLPQSVYVKHLITSYTTLKCTPLPSILSLHHSQTWPHQYHKNPKNLHKILTHLLYQKIPPPIQASLTRLHDLCLSPPSIK